MQDSRVALRHQWLETIADRYGLAIDSEQTASADASFRSYYRLNGADKSFIVMDAPPSHEDVRPFMKVAGLMQEAGCRVPTIYEADVDNGFLLLSDLGTQTYLDALNEDNARDMMDAATDALVQWQSVSREGVLPVYDRALLTREVDLFSEWYVGRHRQKTLDDRQSAILKITLDRILSHNVAQSNVFVHRDFMPRNLMVSADGIPGILDFQDAVYGPISYDIASLLRDAFISWGEAFVIDTTIRYWEKARRAGLPVPAEFGVFWKDVEWMGLQRHLKVLGIFARINYRDGKPKYLADTPRFLAYVRETANRYDELKGLLYLVDQIEGTVPQYGYTF